MRVRVLGAGSIGSRHAANLAALGAAVDISDTDSSRAAAAEGAYAVPHRLDDLEQYDGVVVASPTVHHLDQARASLLAGCRVMIEKPLALDLHGLDDLVTLSADRLAVAFNLRFHAPVARTVQLVEEGRAGRVLSLRVWFGSWLPDWRPAVDYRTTYSAQRALGGGVLLDAIHELDLVVWLLGAELEVVGAIVDRVGPLDIDTEDTVKALLLSADSVPAEVSLDYLSRGYRRGMEIVGDKATIRLDWPTGQISIEEPGTTTAEVANDTIDRSYEAEARAFLDWLQGGPPLPVDAATGAASVRLAERIRQVAATRR